MNNKEIKKNLANIYRQLYSAVRLFDELSRCEKESGKENPHLSRRVATPLNEAELDVVSSFLGESELTSKLCRIIAEVRFYVNGRWEPAKRWRRINPKLQYYTAGFSLVDECKDYQVLKPKELKRLYPNLNFDAYPTKKQLSKMRKYFAKLKASAKEQNKEFSRESAHENEVRDTLTLVFEHDFKEYLKD